MKLTLRKEDLMSESGGGLEIAVDGFAGDSGVKPTQVFIEFYDGKLAVHVWDGSSEDATTRIVIPQVQFPSRVRLRLQRPHLASSA
jgi:hypothetical protein